MDASTEHDSIDENQNGYYSPEEIEKLWQDCSTVPRRYAALMGGFLGIDYKTAKAKEYATHGFGRRMGTLARCITNAFELLPPELTSVPSQDQLLDASINVQAFVFNVFGSLDNLAWIWVYEKHITEDDGCPLPRLEVGLGKRNRRLRASLTAEVQDYLKGLDAWFDYLEDSRHALAHRIPLYIPPYIVSPTDSATYHGFSDRMSVAMARGDLAEYGKLSDEQDALGRFRPWVRHSFGEGAKPVVLHAQMLADFATVEAVAGRFLAELKG